MLFHFGQDLVLKCEFEVVDLLTNVLVARLILLAILDGLRLEREEVNVTGVVKRKLLRHILDALLLRRIIYLRC